MRLPTNYRPFGRPSTIKRDFQGHLIAKISTEDPPIGLTYIEEASIRYNTIHMGFLLRLVCIP